MSEVTEIVARARTPAQDLLALAHKYAITVVVAVVVFLVAYDNGGFGESTRDTLAIVLWWVLILCIGLGVWPLARVSRSAWLTGALLAALGLWTLLSVLWAADVAGAYAEFTRVMLYLAVFAVTVAGSRRDNAGRWVDGLALGIVAVAVVALVSRLFPGTLGDETIRRLLPEGQNRLSFPIGYWNGLAILVALGIPLLLRASIAARSVVTRGLALAPVPVIAGVIYLASSRAGVVCAVLGTVVFILSTSSRWSALAAAVVAAAGSAAVVLALYNRDALVNGPLGSAAAESQGRSAFLIILGLCVLTALLYSVGLKSVGTGIRVNPAVGWAVLAVSVVVVLVGIVLAHPVRRFEDFKKPPTAFDQSSGIEHHLTSGSGNGRWQLWQAAWKEFESKPLQGRGAGSYQSWWAQHGTISGFVQDAHSLYLETLGELGVVGFALLALTFVTGLVVAGRRLLRVASDQRLTLAAAFASFVGFAAAAAVDWMWELTIVSVVAFVCLGLMVGPGTAPAPRPRAVRPSERPLRSRLAIGLAVILGGWLVICAVAIPLLAGVKIRDSQRAVGAGDLRAALTSAQDARNIQPWSSAPYTQLALIAEEAGDYDSARAWIQRAIERDRADWELWLLAARFDTSRGAVRQATRDLARARALNPRSPLTGG